MGGQRHISTSGKCTFPNFYSPWIIKTFQKETQSAVISEKYFRRQWEVYHWWAGGWVLKTDHSVEWCENILHLMMKNMQDFGCVDFQGSQKRKITVFHVYWKFSLDTFFIQSQAEFTWNGRWGKLAILLLLKKRKQYIKIIIYKDNNLDWVQFYWLFHSFLPGASSKNTKL